MARVYAVDGTQREVTPAHGVSFTLEELHALVGGYIEVVRLPSGDLMVINEEGKLHDLLYNERATALAASVLFAGDYIAGPAVVLSLTEMGG